MLKIRRLLKWEISLLKEFPPEDWQMNLPKIVSFYFDYSYFYPIVAEIDNQIVGFGNGILNGKTGWLGNIIVLPEHRKKGIGSELTKHMVEYFKNRNCTAQLLIASNMGKNIYGKLGFKESSVYYRFKGNPGISDYTKNKNITKINKKDIHKLKELDREVSGEERFHIIKRFIPGCLIYEERDSEKIGGFYLPDFGSGLIIANNPEAGLELLKYGLSQGNAKVVIPSANRVAYDYLIKEGFQNYLTLPRMVLGDDVNWQPDKIYNRASGYCG